MRRAGRDVALCRGRSPGPWAAGPEPVPCGSFGVEAAWAWHDQLPPLSTPWAVGSRVTACAPAVIPSESCEAPNFGKFIYFGRCPIKVGGGSFGGVICFPQGPWVSHFCLLIHYWLLEDKFLLNIYLGVYSPGEIIFSNILLALLLKKN